MEATQISILGKPVKFQFGILACRKYCEGQGIRLDQMGEALAANGAFGLIDMFYYAHEAYCALNDKECTITKDQATDQWTAEINEADLKTLTEKVMDIKLFGKRLNEHQAVKGGPKGKKKAATSAKSTK